MSRHLTDAAKPGGDQIGTLAELLASTSHLTGHTGAVPTGRQFPASLLTPQGSDKRLTNSIGVKRAGAANGLTVPVTSHFDVISDEVAAQGVGPVLAFGGGYASANAGLRAAFALISAHLAGAGDANNLGGYLSFWTTSTAGTPQERWRIEQLGTFRPGTDNSWDIGTASHRIKNIFSANPLTVTSDARDKQDIAPLDDVLLDAWHKVEWSQFTLRGADVCSGGLVAQQVIEALASVGVDAEKIGLVRRMPMEKGADPDQPDRTDRLFLVYDYAFAIEAAWHRREMAQLRHALVGAQ
jgi:Chaperone of endosialidase